MTEQKEPSPDQTQPSISDGGGKRRLSSDDNALAKRPKLTTTNDIGITSAEEHNMNVGDDESKASVQSRGKETANGNLQGNPVLAQHTTSGIAESLYADADGASSVTQTGPLDNVEYGNELANKGELEVNLEDKDVLTWRSQEGNSTRYVLTRYYGTTLLTLSEVAVSMKALFYHIPKGYFQIYLKSLQVRVLDKTPLELKEVSPDTIIQDDDGERRLSSVSADTKRLKLTSTEDFYLKNVTGAEEHNMNVGNDDSVQSQGEERAQKNPKLATSGIAKSLCADADNAANETAMRTSGDIIAHGDELTNMVVEDNLDGKNTTTRQSEGGNNAWYVLTRYYSTLVDLYESSLDDKSSPLSDLFDLSDSEKPPSEDLGLDHFKYRDVDEQMSPNTDDHEPELYKIDNSGEENIPIAGGLKEVMQLLGQKVHEMLRILHIPDITDREMHELTFRVGQTSKL